MDQALLLVTGDGDRMVEVRGRVRSAQNNNGEDQAGYFRRYVSTECDASAGFGKLPVRFAKLLLLAPSRLPSLFPATTTTTTKSTCTRQYVSIVKTRATTTTTTTTTATAQAFNAAALLGELIPQSLFWRAYPLTSWKRCPVTSSR